MIMENTEKASSKKTNVSVGVLGHVDSGKTSLCKELSQTASTAAFDQNPQSQERGITLDLGFSAFSLEDKWNVTLVDCPGHASLIRTVLGGIQIMDVMLLVLDITKGMQTQSSECLILADVLAPHLIIALNKVDLLPPDTREAKIEKARKMLKATLARTKFGENTPVILCSASDKDIGVSGIKDAILGKIQSMDLVRHNDRPFVMAVDHCFQKKGQGTICTGTIIQGTVKIGDMVEIPEQKIQRKVKTIQSFKVPLTIASAGDRVGMCIGAFDASSMERGILSTPDHVSIGTKYALMKLNRIKYYKHAIASKSRFHISIGYETTTALVTLFQHPKENFKFDHNLDYEYTEEIPTDKASADVTYFAVLEFDRPVTTLEYAKIIGSNLQIPPNSNECRLSFYGEVEGSLLGKEKSTFFSNIKIFKYKKRQGILDRVTNSRTVIARGFCQKNSNIDHLLGCSIDLTFAGESEPTVKGVIESRFGQTDKIRVGLNQDLTDSQTEKCKQKQVEVSLVHKKYLFREDARDHKKLIQNQK